MPNSFFNNSIDLLAFTKIRAAAVEANLSAVEAGFDAVSVQLLLRGAIAGQTWTGAHNFTGSTVTVATQAAGDNTTKVASTSHVFAERSNAATLTNKTLTAPAISSPTGLVKADVGLANVDNTADSGKPVSTAAQAALNLKANLAGAALTGVPTAPTAAVGTNTDQLATCKLVRDTAFSFTAGVSSLNGLTGPLVLKTVNGVALTGAGDIPVGLSVSVVTATTQTAVAGTHYVLTNVAATTVTLPASPVSGDTVWVTPTNGLATNVIARNGQTVMGLAEDMTIDSTAGLTVALRFVNASWRLV